MLRMQDILILIPTYNEAGNIRAIIEEVFRVDHGVSVLILDDNSPDGTADIVRSLSSTYPRVSVLQRMRDRGFAKSYMEGFARVLGDNVYAVVVMMDADFSHEPKEIPALLAILNDGADVALGSRHVKGEAFPGISLWRRILSRFSNTYVRIVLGLPIHDCTSGYIAMKSSVLRAINLPTFRSEGYGFLFEMKYRMHRAGFRMVEHPVRWPNRHQGQSKMTWEILWESFLLPWKIKRSVSSRKYSSPLPRQQS